MFGCSERGYRRADVRSRSINGWKIICDRRPRRNTRRWIYLADAFKFLFRQQTPDWRAIERRCDSLALAVALPAEFDPNKTVLSEKCRSELAEAMAPLETAHFKANEWIRNRISEGDYAHIWDPATGKRFQLPPTGWGMVLEKSAIETNFVGPDDMNAPGPNTIVDGARRPVFFNELQFKNFLDAENALKNAAYKTGAAGRPSAMQLVEMELKWRLQHPEQFLSASPTEAAKSLIDWLKATHPGAPPLTAKIITNKHSEDLKKLTGAQK